MENKRNNNCGIYCWKNLQTDKWYIGQSKSLNKRESDFLCFNRDYSGNYINKARKKYPDKKYWDYSILKFCKEDELDSYEEFFISIYETNKKHYGYNLTNGGGGNRGYKLSDEQKIKISKGNKGKKRSEEVRNKISESHKGKIFTEEHKIKLSNSAKRRKRKPLSEETKRKISVSNKGISPTNEVREKIKRTLINKELSKKVIFYIDPKNEEFKIFKSVKEASISLGICKNTIRNICLGKQEKTKKGYKFKYIS